MAKPTARAQMQSPKFDLTDEGLQYLIDNPHDEHDPDLIPVLAMKLLHLRERNRVSIDRIDKLERRLLTAAR